MEFHKIERVFIISIRDDIDHGYQFPAKYELKLRLKDLLEETVNEKYYLSDKMLAYFINNNKQKLLGNGFSFNPTEGDGISATVKPAFGTKMTDTFIKETVILKNQAKDFEKTEISNTLLARDYKGIGNQAINAVIETQDLKPTRLFNIYGESCGTGYAGNVWDKNGLSPALMTAQGGNRQPMIIDDSHQMTIDEFLPVKEATKKGYKEAHDGDYVNLQYPNSETRRGRVGNQIANTLLCNDGNGVVKNLRIRKLTPKECFRLMGFDDKDCDILVQNKISNTQLYKMAGNSIVVDVLEEIFVELLNQYEDVFPMR